MPTKKYSRENWKGQDKGEVANKEEKQRRGDCKQEHISLSIQSINYDEVSSNDHDRELINSYSQAGQGQTGGGESNNNENTSTKTLLNSAFSNPSELIESDSQFHEQHSLYKKYMQPSLLQENSYNLISQYQNQQAELVQEDDSIESQSQIKSKTNFKYHCEQQSDLLPFQTMIGIYNSYNPLTYPEEEILLLKDVIQSFEQTQSFGKEYLNLVYEQYRKRMGKMSKQDVQEKLVSDVLFLLRQENFKNTRNIDIFPPQH